MRFSTYHSFIFTVLFFLLLFLPAPSMAQVPPFQGYTLYSPNLSYYTYLIDMNGTIVHSWYNNKHGGYSVYLLENGHIVRPASPNMTYLFGGGSAGLVQEIDINGALIWQFEYNSNTYLTHHDLAPMPNGNVLAIAWEVKTAAQAVQAGRNVALVMWPDHIIEIQPDGQGGGSIVWQWHVWDHLIQDYDPTKDNYGLVADHPELIDINMPIWGMGGPGSGDWLHLNGIDYNEELDQIILSSHYTDEFYVLDHSTTTAQAASHSGGNSGMGGDILYRWGSPSNYHRVGNEYFDVIHCSVWIPQNCPGAGNILTFNNGEATHISQIVEVIPPVDEQGHYYIEPGCAFAPVDPAWVYSAGTSFYSNHLGSCQRFPNGNTLICESTSGDMFETDSLYNVVWTYNTSYEIARCLRYPPDYPGIQAIIPNAVERKTILLPEFEIAAYPNPFNSSVVISYQIQKSGWVILHIYNTLGLQVKSLLSEYQNPGRYELKWEGTDNTVNMTGAGIYFCRMQYGNQVETVKILKID